MPSKTKIPSGRAVWRALVVLVPAIVFGRLAHRANSQTPTATIVVHARRYAFAPSAISLKKDQTVKLVLISDDVLHGLAVKGLGIRTDIVPRHRNEVLVTPSQVGDFLGSCSVYCGSGHRDMEFTVHVVE
jgi:cytochrome c oxidase subunit II